MVRKQPQWALGSNQYVKRPRTDAQTPTPATPLRVNSDRMRDTGVTWGDFDVSLIPASDIERTRHRFRAQLPDLIWNTAALEGNNFTLPEVRTLLDGVTVGGHKTEDENQILSLSEGYSRLDELVGSGEFKLNKQISDELHGLVAIHEAIESGHFRGEGNVRGGGTVNLSNGGSVPGTEHGDGGVYLREHHDDLMEYLDTLSDPRERALVYFASATRRQFYFDGNKRTARLMMTGELMSNGFDIVSIPYARKLELNNALDVLFSTDDATELLRFLTTCAAN